uniref:Uncharacterized protein n=1 Tax=Sphaerodactylus townsendi TaxID=933632 RepID=A0ACB8EET2_9SAUR
MAQDGFVACEVNHATFSRAKGHGMQHCGMQLPWDATPVGCNTVARMGCNTVAYCLTTLITLKCLAVIGGLLLLCRDPSHLLQFLSMFLISPSEPRTVKCFFLNQGP